MEGPTEPEPRDAPGHVPRRISRYRETVVAFLRDDLPWLAPALSAGLIVYVLYLASHPYPAFGSGLYLLMAEEISRHGYGLPARIPFYTEGGIPFAYPPLAFYAVAPLLDLGVDPLALSRYLPGVLTIVYLVPAYLLGRDLLGSRQGAGLATFLVAVETSVLQWHIEAAGLVRATAYLFLLSGLVAGLRLFRTGERRWLLASTLFLSLTVLTHPKYVVFFVASYLLFWLVYDPSPRGLAHGALVATGGLVLTAPWWAQVVATHGGGIFLDAAGTHRGVGRFAESLSAFLTLYLYGPDVPMTLAVFRSIPIVACAYLLATRRPFLPLWALAAVLVTGEARFAFLVGAFATAALLVDGVVPAVRGIGTAGGGIGTAVRGIEKERLGRAIAVGAVALVAVPGLVLAGAYVTSNLDAHAGSPSMPAYVDGHDVEAMAWVEAETPPDATFVVLGDEVEWFPYFTRRTILVGPWGVEWEGEAAFDRQDSTYRRLAACDVESCVEETLREGGFRPDYVYLPKGTYSIRGKQVTRDPRLARSMAESGRYRPVYENEGAVVYRVVE